MTWYPLTGSCKIHAPPAMDTNVDRLLNTLILDASRWVSAKLDSSVENMVDSIAK
ncbi:hypothetical protein D1872_340020 [compost metagenome]